MATAIQTIFTAKDETAAAFKSIEGHLSKLNVAFGTAGGSINKVIGMVGVMSGILAGGAMFKGIIDATTSWTGETVKLSKTLGMSLEQASTYRTALALTGIDTDTLAGAGLRLAKTLGSNEAAFQSLGIATRDNSGHLRSTADLLPEVNEKLASMRAGTDRNVLAMTIYGRSWGEVQNLLKLTPALMKEAEESARRLHLVVGPDGAEQAKKYKYEMNELGLVQKSLQVQIGTVLIPSLVKLGAAFTDTGINAAGFFATVADSAAITMPVVDAWVAKTKAKMRALFADTSNSEYLAELKAIDQMYDYKLQRASETAGGLTTPLVKAKTRGTLSGDQVAPDESAATAEKMSVLKKGLNDRLAIIKQHNQETLKTEEAKYQLLAKMEDGYMGQLRKDQDEILKRWETMRGVYTSALGEINGIIKANAEAESAAQNAYKDEYTKRLEYLAKLQTEELKLSEILNPEERIKKATEIAAGYNTAKTAVVSDGAEIISLQQAMTDSTAGVIRMKEAIDATYADSANKMAAETARLEAMWQTASGEAQRFKNVIDDIKKGLEALSSKEYTIGVNVTGLEDLQRIMAASGRPMASGDSGGGTSGGGTVTTSGLTAANPFALGGGGGSAGGTSWNWDSGSSLLTINGSAAGPSAMGSTNYYEAGGNFFWGDGTWAGPAYASGTSYVPSTGLALLHQGEAVIPAEFNEYYQQLWNEFKSKGGWIPGGDNFAAAGFYDKELIASRLLENWSVPRDATTRERMRLLRSDVDNTYAGAWANGDPRKTQYTPATTSTAPAAKSSSGATTMNFTGPLNFTLPNVDNAREFAKALLPELQQLSLRFSR